MDMIEQTTERDLGTVDEAADGTVTLRYERVFSRPIETVWLAITEPARLADWLGPAELEPRAGGRFAVRVGPGGRVPIDGKVVVWEPPSVLACTWNWPEGPAGTIRYELSPAGAHATRLIFTHSALPAGRQNSVLAGWHLYLERLEQAVRGERPPEDFSARHAEVRALYGDVEACATAG